MRSKDQHRYRPQIEAMESVVALSGAAGALHQAAVPAAIVAQPASLLQGTIQGAYVSSLGNPDTGKTYRVGAAGRINPIGQTGDTAQLHTTGFIAQGMATGTMSLAASRGTLKLKLTGPTQPGFAPLPTTFTYQIVGGTRAFRNVTGSGTVNVTLSPSVVSSSLGEITFRFIPGTAG